MTQPEALRLAHELSKSHLNHYVNHAAAAELRRLYADAEESEALRERLSELLRNTAIALRGPEPELTRWSWHDLPELATALKAQRDALLEALESAEVDPHSSDAVYKAITALKAALAGPEGGGNLPPPLQEPTIKGSLQVPAEVAATLTTTDIAWLATCRLTKLWQELGQMRWVGADEGWDRAIEAVRSRLNDECQDVLDWKAKADQSQATAIQLLRKMQGVNDD